MQHSGARTRRGVATARLLAPLFGAALVLAGTVVILGRNAPREAAASDLRGTLLPEPRPAPAFTLHDLDGRPYDFRAATAGKLALLFFGYTHCPDVCPLHMANLAAALRTLPEEARGRTEVVFVTADPARDTPERLREWLGAFDPSFVGLRGSVEEVNAVLAELRLAPVMHDAPDSTGAYAVGHPAQILAFTPDGMLRALYPSDTRQEDWAHDIRALLGLGHEGGATSAGTEEERVGGIVVGPELPPEPGPVEASLAYVPAPAGTGPAALYVVVRNRTGEADALVGVRAPVAERAELHRQAGGEAMSRMEAVEEVPLPANGEARLEPGGYHVMLHGLSRPLAPGDTMTVQLRFRRAGTVPARAVVVPYGALEHVLGSGIPAAHPAH